MPNITKKDGGIFQYTEALIKNLAKIKNPDFHFYLFNVSDTNRYYQICRDLKNIDLIPLDKTKESILHKVKRHTFFFMAKIPAFQKVKQYSYIDPLIDKYKIDIVYCPYQDLPENLNIPGICTLHDLQELHFPEYFSAEERAKRANKYLNLVNSSSSIIVSYDHVKNDIIRYFDFDEDKIFVFLLNMSDLWFEKYSEKDILSLAEYNLPKNFCLYPAATWPHKNHINLVKAIYFLKSEFDLQINLVLTGSQNDHYKEIIKLATELEVLDLVFFLGIVGDQELYSLYKKCVGVIVPTKYEAGSFPLMESMLLGIPVICSNVTSLPETISNNQYCFDPDNIDNMAQLIKRLITDSEFLAGNIENSNIHKQRLTNNETVNNLLMAFTRTNSENL